MLKLQQELGAEQNCLSLKGTQAALQEPTHFHPEQEQARGPAHHCGFNGGLVAVVLV